MKMASRQEVEMVRATKMVRTRWNSQQVKMAKVKMLRRKAGAEGRVGVRGINRVKRAMRKRVGVRGINRVKRAMRKRVGVRGINRVERAMRKRVGVRGINRVKRAMRNWRKRRVGVRGINRVKRAMRRAVVGRTAYFIEYMWCVLQITSPH